MSAQSNAVTPARLPLTVGKSRNDSTRAISRKADAIDLRLDDGDDPVQGVHRKSDRQHRGKETGQAGKLAGRSVGFERLDQLIRPLICGRVQCGQACCAV